MNGEPPDTEALPLPVPHQRPPTTTAEAFPRCPMCLRPLRLRVDLIDLNDGTCAVDAERLRLALSVHMRRCDGR